MKRRWFAVLLSIPLASGSVWADSELYFPRLSFAANEITGVAIVNPNAEDAVVTLTAYTGAGAPLSGAGFTNPVQIIVGAGRQYADVTAVIFGAGSAPPEVGWIKASSAADDLSGFFLYLTADFSVFDGADLPEPATDIVFNVARIGDGFSTELNLVNPGAAPATATLRLLGGDSPVSKEVTLAALGGARLDVEELFGAAADLAGRALYVEASAASEILGFEFVRGPGDLLGLNAKPASERLNRLFFPQLAVLGVFESQLQLVNTSDETVILTLTAHQPDGTPYGSANLQNNPVNRVLRAGETLREDLAEMFGFSGSEGLDGWLEVASTSDAVNGAMSYEIPSINSRASVASIAQSSERAVFSYIATTQDFFTGVAILNAAQLSANVQVAALRPDGTSLGSYSTALLPGQRISRLITELIPASDGQAGGMIFVRSDAPVYLTSLFGNLRTGVLANIPPQAVPADFQPASVGAAATLQPSLAILSPAAAQQFGVEGVSGTPTWSVNGVDGGNASLGTVSASGQYRAPAVIPEDLPVTVLAQSSDRLVGASVDILSPEAFLGDLGLVQSVAYLEGAQRVYFSELTAVAAAGRPVGLRGAGPSSRLRELQGSAPRTVVEFPGDEIPKIIPFTASDGQEYLLAAAQTTGRVLRVDPRTGGVREIATGLDEPSALVLDTVESELLVAEAEQVSAIPVADLSVGLASAPPGTQGGLPPPSRVFASARGRVTVDQCTGNAYVSLAEQGRLLEYRRSTGAIRSVVDGLQNPGQPLALYREGLGCPDSFHLLLPERGTESILLVVPNRDLVRPWLDLSGVQDLTFIPPGSEAASEGGVLVASLNDSVGSLSLVQFPGLYATRGLNPPRRPERSGCSLTQLTDTRGEAVTEAHVSGDGQRVLVVATADLAGQNADGSSEIFSFDRGGVVQLTNLAAGRGIHDLSVSRDGTRMVFRSDARLTANAPAGINLYLLDTASSELTILARNQEGRAHLDQAGNRVVFASRNDPLGSNSDGNPEIFLMDSETGLAQITETRASGNATPNISGDGNRIVFRSTADLAGRNPGRATAVFVYDVAAGTFELIGVEEDPPRELPDTELLIDGVGNRVVFPSKLDLTNQQPAAPENLYFADVELGTTRRILPVDSTIRWRSLTADGRFLSVASSANPAQENRDRNREAFIYDLDNGKIVQLTRSKRASNSQPRLSSEGGVVTVLSNADFTRENADGNTEVFRFGCSLPRPEGAP